MRSDGDETVETRPPRPPSPVDALAGAETMVAPAETVVRETLASAGTILAEGGPTTLPIFSDDAIDDASLGSSARRRRLLLPAGARIGRYEIIEPLGAGGMGEVYRAYDPELDRWLAIKILREERRARRDEARFLREAQAMARLSHPNVVPVHDVGISDQGLFLAMELVEGQTLRGWLREQERGWREIVAIFIEAGRGLAEAHAAGIVHRDFKPENVLVDRRGRPRVTDFGLARPEGGEGGSRARLAAVSLGSSGLTRSGTIMGTPAYMAPEQLSGRKVDGRADLFAFCVVLYEALFQTSPYGGATIGERLAVIVDGKLQEAPRRGVPRWLVRALSRGLQAEPDARWPSMEALLGALEGGLQRRRSAWVAALALPPLALVGLLALRGDEGERCEVDQALAGVWGEAEEAAIAARFAAADLDYAQETWSKANVLLDRYADAWLGLRRGTCEAHARGEISSELLDRRALCLDRRRADLGVVVDALREAGPATIERAVELAQGLGDVDGCVDPEEAPAGAASEAHAAWAEDVRIRLARARIQGLTERQGEALEAVDGILGEVTSLGDVPLRLEALDLRARIESDRGEHEASEGHLVEVFEEAHARGLDRLATRAAAHLIFVVGEGRARYAVGEAWARIALAGARRIGDDGREEATARHWLGVTLSSADRVDEAQVELRRAHELRLALLGPDHLETSGSATALGNVLWKAGRLEEAVALHQSSLATREAALGSRHPTLIVPLGNLGVALSAVGRSDEARVAWTRARDLVVARFSAEHPNAAVLEANLGGLEVTAGDYPAATRHLEAAVKAARASLGEHPDTALILQNLGDLRRRAGDLEGAEAALDEALRMSEATVGPEHSNVAVVKLSLARLRRAQGRADEARALLEAALANLEAAFGGEHPRLVEVLLELGDAARAAGEGARALALLRRARAIVDAREVSPAEGAEVYFELGRAMIAAGEGGDEAAGLIARALTLAEGAGPSGRALVETIRAWRAGEDAAAG